MGTPTSKLGLTKFGNQDPYNIATLNTNYDKMDAAADKMNTQLPFDAARTRFGSASVGTFTSGWKEYQTQGGIRRFGPYCWIRVLAERTGADLTTFDSGNIANQTIIDLNSAYNALHESPLVTLSTQRVACGYVGTGLVRLAAYNPGTGPTATPLRTGDVVDLCGWYILATAVA